MPKLGLGGIMAQVSMDLEKEKLKKLEAPACPFCGEAMQTSGAGWFCQSNKETKQCGKLREIEEAFRSAPEEVFRSGSDLEPIQGQTLAAIVGEGGEVLATLSTVRGDRGKTNIRIWLEKEGIGEKDIPLLVQKHGWTFQDWLAPVLEEAE